MLAVRLAGNTTNLLIQIPGPQYFLFLFNDAGQRHFNAIQELAVDHSFLYGHNFRQLRR
jgi:hypothetical protein